MKFLKPLFLFCAAILLSGCLCCPLWPPKEGGSTTTTAAKVTTTLKTTLKTTTTESGSLEGQITASLSELIGGGTSLECTYEDSSGGVKSTVTVYISGRRFRMDARVGGAELHSISDGVWVYTWSTISSVATKVRLDALEGHQTDLPSNVGVDLTSDVALYCKPWKVQDSVFEPPSGVEFTDATGELEGGAGGGAVGGSGGGTGDGGDPFAQICAVCDGKSDPRERAFCRQQFGC